MYYICTKKNKQKYNTYNYDRSIKVQQEADE